MDKFDSLPEHKQTAIELLVIGDPQQPFKRLKYGEIADMLGIAEFTLRRWRADPEFQAAKREFRDKYVKDQLVDEAARTLMRSMRTKDSTHAAEVALKYAGEMVERRATEVTGTVTQQIDVKSSDTQALLERVKKLQRDLGLPEDVSLYLGVGDVVDAEVVENDEKDVEND